MPVVAGGNTTPVLNIDSRCGGMPRPSGSLRPLCEFSGIRTSTRPSGTGTLTVAPNTASRRRECDIDILPRWVAVMRLELNFQESHLLARRYVGAALTGQPDYLTARFGNAHSACVRWLPAVLGHQVSACKKCCEWYRDSCLPGRA